MPPASNLDPNALLCERCGYSIANLRESEPCPECGQPAGQSWPKLRSGSFYQTRKNVAGRWFWANVEVLRSPRRLFRRVRIEAASTWRLLFANVMLAATCAGGVYLASVHRNWFFAVIFVWVFTLGGLLLLTYIETLGLRFFAKAESRRWRLTRDVVWTVCNHASVGWLVGGVSMLILWAADPADAITSWAWLNTQLYRFSGGVMTDYLVELHIAQTLLPLVIGVVAFETLVYLGIRQCRYANTPASASQQGPAASPA